MAKKKKTEEIIIGENERIIKVDLEAIGEFSRKAFLDYGDYINNHRHMADLRDGCKISYRRLIYSASTFPKGKFNKTGNFIANVQNYHSHAIDSLNDLNAAFVRAGIFEGNGAFGYTGILGDVNPPAAPRYTETKLSDLYQTLIGDLIKEVPFVESEGGAPEPEYIPMPIPLCLMLSGIGLGISIRADYPNFSPTSMYQAYIKNDPSLLESNTDLIIDKRTSELDKIWNTGKGKVTYVYKITRRPSDDGKTEGILFETDKRGTEIFTPAISKFNKLIEDGKVFIDDLTDINGPKLFIGRVPGARGITVDDIETLARKICYKTQLYQLNVTNGTTTFRIPLKDWLDYTLNNYVKFINQVNQKRISEVEFNIEVQKAIPIIANYIINVNSGASDTELQTKLGLSIDIIKEVMSKPISYLRKNKDTSERVKELQNKLKELKQFNPTKFTEDIINKL